MLTPISVKVFRALTSIVLVSRLNVMRFVGTVTIILMTMAPATGARAWVPIPANVPGSSLL